METRREFLKKMALLSGAAGVSTVLPESIQKAMAIDPQPGSTFMDAEHIVFLMQENRSFDHCFGTLRGVRGYNDPRTINLPNKNNVWLQTNKSDQTYAPFRLNIKDTKITWMGSLPHSRTSQIDAWNNGKYDQWIEAKKSGWKEYANMPLTMGHYTREDIPFYYALADAFTVCDQNFCGSLTPTDPNRLLFWTGTVREKQNTDAKAYVRNENVDFQKLDWKTFPEQLEENDISWKVYQNELYIHTGLTPEEDQWLGNFGDNSLEYFKQYNVKLFADRIKYLQKLKKTLPQKIQSLNEKLAVTPNSQKLKKQLKKLTLELEDVKQELAKWNSQKYERLSEREKAIHQKAFTINDDDPEYRELSELTYDDHGTQRKMNVPKSDVLYQFRKDVEEGKLPTVSWLVAANNFSDHPDAPWYGAWYVSEVLDILTKNPEVWKKTIFILTYDENDGYFDHVPPFVCPNPEDPETGKTSPGVNDGLDYVHLQQEIERKDVNDKQARGGPIGLGYRVPLVIASPWSRGGYVNSEVFDHTSSLQFLEHFLNKKFGKHIKETNISKWRRTVTGDLTSTFRPYKEDKKEDLPFIARDQFVETIHNAKFKNPPSDYKALNANEIAEINRKGAESSLMPQQEKGIRPACPSPYQLEADGVFHPHKKSFEITFLAKNNFGTTNAEGAPFNVFAPGKYRKNGEGEFEDLHFWSFAVTAGDKLTHSWPLKAFENGIYHLNVHGPNGFYRAFMGNEDDPDLQIKMDYSRNMISRRPNGNIEITFVNNDKRHPQKIHIVDHAYKQHTKRLKLGKAGSSTSGVTLKLDLNKSYQWYDFSVKIDGYENFERRYAGHVETGETSYSDPAMGKMI